MQTTIRARVVMLNARGEVLLLRRSKTEPDRPDELEFPGGTVEVGEDFTAGMLREILEETGLDISIDDIYLIYTDTEPGPTTGNSVIRFLFCTTVDNPEITLSQEHYEYRWVSEADALAAFPHLVYGKGFRYGIENKLLPYLRV